MRSVALSEAKDHLSEYVSAAQAGQDIIITRHGKPAAKLVAIPATPDDRQAKKLAAIAMLQRHRDKLRAEGRTATIEEMIAWKNEGQR
jgi:prevent-host-death family protein